ncbi:MAG: hypothetical protein HZB36_00995 [Candidatus Omnitrophica bacterium]|nr:hypothetical protein [Candidatus Omnitrophota bacterium]
MAKKKRQIHLYEKIQKGKPLFRSEVKELENFEGPSPDPGIVDTQEQVARVFNVKLRTVGYWVKDGMPVRPDRKYSVKEISDWRLVKSHGPGNNQKSFGWGEKEKQEIYWKKYKAKTAEAEYKKLIGELIPRSEVERGRIDRIQTVKKALLALPKRMAPQLVGLEAREIEIVLKERMEEIIADFSGHKNRRKSLKE